MDLQELLMSTCENNKPAAINLWDYQTTNSVFQYKSGGPISKHMVAQLQNDYIVGANREEPKLYLWQMNSHEPLKNFRLILPEVASCLSVCPHGIYLAVGIKTYLYIWQLASGKLLTIQRRNMRKITVVKFSGNGSLLIVADEGGILSTYKLVRLVSLHKNDLSHREVGQTEPVYSRSDHTEAITDIHVGCFALRSKIATCSLDQTVKIYNLLTGSLIQNIITENSVYSFITDCSFLNAYIGCSNGVLLTCNITDNNYQINSEEMQTKKLSFQQHTKAVKCLCLNQRGNILASGGDDGIIILWNTKSACKVITSIKMNSPITNLKFILNHQNILCQNFQVDTAIMDLEMDFNLSHTNFGITVLRNSPIECFKRKRNSVEKELELERLEKENMSLRAMNQQMYKFTQELLKNKIDKN